MEEKIIKSEKAKPVKNAFEVIQKLYQKSSSLIREIEVFLNENEHQFQLFSDGDCICSRTSIGLESKAENQSEPQLVFGVFHDIKLYTDWVKKRGNILVAIEYDDDKLFSQFPNVDYENDNFKLKAKLKKVNLLDINSTDELIEKVMNPSIQIYEQQ